MHASSESCSNTHQHVQSMKSMRALNKQTQFLLSIVQPEAQLHAPVDLIASNACYVVNRIVVLLMHALR